MQKDQGRHLYLGTALIHRLSLADWSRQQPLSLDGRGLGWVQTGYIGNT